MFYDSCYIPFPGELIGVDYLLKQTGQPPQDMTPDSEAPDIDDVEATTEEFEDTPQEDTPDLTIGSLMESDPLRMTSAQEPTDQTPKHHEVIGHLF